MSSTLVDLKQGSMYHWLLMRKENDQLELKPVWAKALAFHLLDLNLHMLSFVQTQVVCHKYCLQAL